MRRLFSIISLTILFTSLYAQKSELLPEDLNSSKVIFLKYEQIENDPRQPYSLRQQISHRNKISVEANRQLKLGASYYPYDYVLSTRSEYFDLKEQGYKYVLENDLMNAYNNGEVVEAAGNKIYAANMYLMDLETGKRFELFTVKQHNIYDYDMIMKKFCKIVKKEFD